MQKIKQLTPIFKIITVITSGDFIKIVTLKLIINRLNNKIKNFIAKEKQKSWSNFLSSLSPEDNSLWNIKKKLNNNYNLIPPPPLLLFTAYTGQDKAEILVKTYAEQFFPESGQPWSLFNIHQTIQNFLATPLPEIQPAVISNIIKNL